MFARQHHFQYVFILFQALLVLSIATEYDASNKGTEFIFGFIPNLDHASLELVITTDIDEDIDVTVDTPIYDSAFQRIVTVRKNVLRKVVLSSELMSYNYSNEMDNKGIRVSAKKGIMVYASSRDKATADGFVLLPVNVLGNEYYIMAWQSFSTFVIVGIENDTEISITLKNEGQNSSYTVRLEKFQTYFVYVNGDLTGTRIFSSKHVAVISGNICGNLHCGYCDHMVQQLLPVSIWGHDFVAIGMPNCKGLDTFRVMSSERNTTLYVKGYISAYLDQPGDFYTIILQDTLPIMVTSDKPIALVLYPNGLCNNDVSIDPSAIPIPAVAQYSNNYTFETTELEGVQVIHSLAIVISEVNKNGLIIDGEALTNIIWTTVIGQNDMVYADFLITNGTHSIKHLNSSVSFMAFSTGIQKDVSYGYPLGYHFGQSNKMEHSTQLLPLTSGKLFQFS